MSTASLVVTLVAVAAYTFSGIAARHGDGQRR
jgi:hypothetical protein